MKLYVDCNAGRNGNGSKEMPFKTIREAAKAWSHLRGVKDISPEVPLSFGIRRVLDGSCGS